MYIKKHRNQLTDTEKKLVFTSEDKKEGEVRLGYEIKRHKLLCIN